MNATSPARIVLALVLSTQLILAGMPASAGTISTSDYLAADGVQGTSVAEASLDRQARLQRVRDFLAQERVQAQIESYGVDPAQAAARAAALSDAELARLDRRLSDLPAGGSVIGVVGLVFVVLLILELVGVTDIFKRF